MGQDSSACMVKILCLFLLSSPVLAVETLPGAASTLHSVTAVTVLLPGTQVNSLIPALSPAAVEPFKAITSEILVSGPAFALHHGDKLVVFPVAQPAPKAGIISLESNLGRVKTLSPEVAQQLQEHIRKGNFASAHEVLTTFFDRAAARADDVPAAGFSWPIDTPPWLSGFLKIGPRRLKSNDQAFSSEGQAVFGMLYRNLWPGQVHFVTIQPSGERVQIDQRLRERIDKGELVAFELTVSQADEFVLIDARYVPPTR